MITNKTFRGSSPGIAIGIILLATLSSACVGTAETMEYSGDAIIGSVAYGTMVWNSTNFPALVVNETLSVLSVVGTENRVIAENNLEYHTSEQQEPLKVVEVKYTGAEAAAAGLEGFGAGNMAIDAGNYTIIGWMTEKYVAIKAKPNKLAKLIIDQDPNDIKSLDVSETWNMGEGWKLTLNSTDTSASPAQVRLILSKDGILKDDTVISSGTPDAVPIYTFVEPSLAGETNVPVLVTYADNITSDTVQLKYTWLISDNVSIIMPGDVFGSMKVTSTSPLELKNTETTILLHRNTIIKLFDDLYFVVNDTSSLEYYPMKTLPGGTISWKFISVPYQLENSTVAYVLSGIQYDALFGFDPVNKIYVSGVTNFEPLKGYLIHMNASQDITNLVRKSGQHQVPPSFDIEKGWNLVGTTGTDPKNAETMLGAIDPSYYSIWNFNVSTQSYDKIGVNGWSGPDSETHIGTVNFTMQPKVSFWVWATQETSLPSFN